MPLARIVCRSDQDALPFVEGLREHGYAVEFVRPDHPTDRHCDLLLEVDSCSQKEAFSRANSFTCMYEDARILIAPGVVLPESAPARLPGPVVPALVRLIHRAWTLKQWRVPVVVAAVITFLAALPAIRRSASPPALQLEQTNLEQQIPFGPVKVRKPSSLPAPAVQERASSVITHSVVVRAPKPAKANRVEPEVAEDEVIVRHFRSRVQQSSRPRTNGHVKRISDLD